MGRSKDRKHPRDSDAGTNPDSHGASSSRVTGAVIVALIGLGFLATGLCFHIAALRFRRRAIRVPAMVVAVHALPTGNFTVSTGSGPLYRPVLEFSTVEGTVVRAESKMGSNPPAGHVGDTARSTTTRPSRIASSSTRGSAPAPAWRSRSRPLVCCCLPWAWWWSPLSTSRSTDQAGRSSSSGGGRLHRKPRLARVKRRRDDAGAESPWSARHLRAPRATEGSFARRGRADRRANEDQPQPRTC